MVLPAFASLPEDAAILVGDARNALISFAPELFQTCITSPPYWGTRDYGVGNQIGAEESIADYICHLREVFREVRRVLRDDGTLWLNIGDTYTSGNRKWRAPDRKNGARAMRYRPPTPEGLKPKDLVGVPWRVAFALQEEGWYLRSDVIWDKPNAQPESVKDRPTHSHEYMFLFSKSERYYYDYESGRERTSCGATLRNARSVWSVKTEAKHPPHLAVFPPQLVRRCLLVSSRAGDSVLDPFAGSGTVGLVCKQEGRSFVGVEIKSEYANLARIRIANAARLARLV